MKKKKVPMRMCLGCNEMKPKKELLRIVLTPEGVLEVDLSSKKNGRGAYLCYNNDCLKKAVKTKKINRTFELEPSKELLQELERQLNESEP